MLPWRCRAFARRHAGTTARGAGRPGRPAAERKITATLTSSRGRHVARARRSARSPFGEPVVEQARRIVEAQIAAPPAPLVSAIPAEARTLRALYISERGDAFVDLSGEVTARHTGGALDELFTVYAIVNALTVNLPAITRVQILVDGKEVDTLAGHVDLRHPAGEEPEMGQDRQSIMTRTDGRAARAAAPNRASRRPSPCTRKGRCSSRPAARRVICTASVEERVPPFLRNTGKGWVTAEYGMLPRATSTRTQREASAGKVGGRTQEIQRLIGRSLRSVTRLPELGERTIWIDCDVIQADGGTRTASITGGFVALVLALQRMRQKGMIQALPVIDFVAATSVGVVDGTPMLDLAYEEDSRPTST